MAIQLKSVRGVHRALHPFYVQHIRTSEQAIRSIIDRFCTIFFQIQNNQQDKEIVRTEENITAAARSVAENVELSIRRRFQLVSICLQTT